MSAPFLALFLALAPAASSQAPPWAGSLAFVSDRPVLRLIPRFEGACGSCEKGPCTLVSYDVRVALPVDLDLVKMRTTSGMIRGLIQEDRYVAAMLDLQYARRGPHKLRVVLRGEGGRKRLVADWTAVPRKRHTLRSDRVQPLPACDPVD